jgi:hypothetical protein
MNKAVMLFAIFLSLFWFLLSTPTSSFNAFARRGINYPLFFGGWAVIAGIVFLLAKLAQGERNQIRTLPQAQLG